MNLASHINSGLSHFGMKLVRTSTRPRTKPGNTYALGCDITQSLPIEVRKLLNLVAYTKTNTTAYNAEGFQGGYHTLHVDDLEFKGQRDPVQRLHDVPFDFDGTSVLDLGCNQGGMLHSLADRIKSGVGVDLDYKMVNAANRIRTYRRFSNIDFYVFDLENENLDLLRNFFTGRTVDIVLLLSVCMWLKNWKLVIGAARCMSKSMLFESNGTVSQQAEQEAYLKTVYGSVDLIHESSLDDPTQHHRRLYLCQSMAPGDRAETGKLDIGSM